MWTESRSACAGSRRHRVAGGLNPGVLAMVRQSPLGEALGDQRMFHNLEQAVAFYQSRYLRIEPHQG